LLAGVFVFMLVTSLLRNIFFPVIEPHGDAALPTRKTVIGAPTFFIPRDFKGCIILGPQFYPRALMINLGEFLVLAALVSAGNRITKSLLAPR
jgi:hypothetical protein